MDHKKYAKDLVQEFMNVNSNKMSDDSMIEYPTAKACALIAINKMMTVTIFTADRTYDDLMEVRKQIELL